LQFFQRGNYRHNLLRTRVGFAPIRKETIAEIFVNYAVLVLDDLLATQNPRSYKNVQVLTLQLAAERRKTANVCDEKPTRNSLDFAQRTLHHLRFVLLRNGDRLSDLESLIPDRDLIAISESNWMMNSPLVQKRSVAAAEINQPKLANVLQMNKRVSARHFGRFQHDRVGSGSSERTTAFDRMACAIGRFQPGTFLWGRAHAEGSYQKAMADAKCLPWTRASSKMVEIPKRSPSRRSHV